MSNDYYIIAPHYRRAIEVGGKGPAHVVILSLDDAPALRPGYVPDYAFEGDEDGPLQKKYAADEPVTFFGGNPRDAIEYHAALWYTPENYPESTYTTFWRDGKFIGIPEPMRYLRDVWLPKYGDDPDLFWCCDSGDAYQVMKRWKYTKYPNLRMGWELDSIYESAREELKALRTSALLWRDV